MISPMFFFCVLFAFTNADKENKMEIYPDSTKTFSSGEVYSLRELQSLYEQVAKKTAQQKDLRNKAHLLACMDAGNHIHSWSLPTDEWTPLDGVRALDTKLNENSDT